ncbi:hypothetical protein NVP1067O_19 [Vibrio phage 1.067.O._10N.261.52.C9]|nr:hypothetical protein NVP1067O_19 [Vibrio phage 1.067.O._10N.261.52.C9]
MRMMIICANCSRLNREEYSFFGRFDFDGSRENRCKICDAKSFKLGFKLGIFDIRYLASKVIVKNKAPKGVKEMGYD